MGPRGLGPWAQGALGPKKIMNSMCFEDMEKMCAESNCLAKQFPHHWCGTVLAQDQWLENVSVDMLIC